MDHGKKFITVVLISPISFLVHGFVLSLLWKWFVTSTFPSIPTLTLVQAIGVMFVVDFFLLKIDWDNHAGKSNFTEFLNNFINHAIFTPFLLLGMGWIIKLFM